jgi:hypothetical protein
LDGGLAFVLAFKGRSGGATDDFGVLAVEFILGQQVADFLFDELEELLVIDEIDLVEEHHQVRHADLIGEEDVLPGLGHRTVSGRDDQDTAVHLGGTGDHVLDEVGVARAVDVRIVALVGLILHVGDRDRDDLGGVTDGAALGDVSVGLDLGEALAGLNRQNRGGQRGFAVVDVTDGADVYVRLFAFECSFSHVE